jgi:hypothetical protein
VRIGNTARLSQFGTQITHKPPQKGLLKSLQSEYPSYSTPQGEVMKYNEEITALHLSKMRPLSAEKLLELQAIELHAISSYRGGVDELESALGFLKLGFQIGWRPLAIMHSKKTFRKYEEILEIDAKQLFEPETPASDRSMGYAIAKTLSNFWKVVSGDIKIDNRREIGNL